MKEKITTINKNDKTPIEIIAVTNFRQGLQKLHYSKMRIDKIKPHGADRT